MLMHGSPWEKGLLVSSCCNLRILVRNMEYSGYTKLWTFSKCSFQTSYRLLLWCWVPRLFVLHCVPANWVSAGAFLDGELGTLLATFATSETLVSIHRYPGTFFFFFFPFLQKLHSTPLPSSVSPWCLLHSGEAWQAPLAPHSSGCRLKMSATGNHVEGPHWRGRQEIWASFVG